MLDHNLNNKMNKINTSRLNLDSYKINKDLLKSTVVHGIIIIFCLIGSLFNHSKVKQHNVYYNVNKINNINSATNDVSLNKPIVQANLIDSKVVLQAIKKQEAQVAERAIKEKNIQQQEQQLAKLTKMVEQEMLKAKKDREQLQKDQEAIQKEATKLKTQAKELSEQQEKIKKLEQKQQQRKETQKKSPEIAKSSSGVIAAKNLVANTQINTQKNNDAISTNLNTNSLDNKVSKDINNNSLFIGDSTALESQLSIIRAKWHADIVNNRKKTTVFPGNLTCSIKIKLLPNGNLAYIKIEKSSGNSAYDYFSEQAIHKSAPFEMPEDPVLNKELIETDHIFDFDDSAFS